MPRHVDTSKWTVPHQMAKSEMLYTPEDSLVRLEGIRRVLKEKDLDALLFVAGVDSGDNLGCVQAINYLLLGACGSDLATPLLLDDDYDDVVLLVHGGGVRLYVPPAAGVKASRITKSWPGLELCGLDRRSFKNQDLFEDHKMANFKAMVPPSLRKVGMSLPNNDPMQIEKWPLVQSYALDSKGERRFFTMCHDVTNVFSDLELVFRGIGTHEVAAMIATQATLLAQHWDGVVQMLVYNAKKGPKQLQDSTAENLETYYSYGAMRRRKILECWGIQPPKMVMHPLHCTVEAYDPQAPLIFARTVFLSANHNHDLNPFGTTSEYTKGIIPASCLQQQETTDLTTLCVLYTVLGRTLQVMKQMAADKESGFGENKANDIKRIKEIFVSLGKECSNVPMAYEEVVHCLRVKVLKLDNGPFTSDKVGVHTRRQHVTYLKLELEVTQTGKPLGSLVIGDTIVASGGVFITLTHTIPSVSMTGTLKGEMEGSKNIKQVIEKVEDIWSTGPQEEAVKKLNSKCPLGSYLCSMNEHSGFLMYMPIQGFGCDVKLSGSLVVFNEGLVIHDTQGGYLQPLLFKEHVDQILVHNPLQLDLPVVIVLKVKEDYKLWAPLDGAQKAASERCVCFVVRPGTTAKREFLQKILPSWKKRSYVKVVKDDEGLPVQYQAHVMYECYTEQQQPRTRPYLSSTQYFDNVKDYQPFRSAPEEPDDITVKMTELKSGSKKIHENIMRSHPQWEQFAKHKRLEALEDIPKMTFVPASTGVVKVDIVTGYFGVGKHKFADHLTKVFVTLNAEKRARGEPTEEVHTIVNTLEEGIEFLPVEFYRQLRPVVSKEGPQRVIYITPGVTPIAIIAHHLAQVAAQHSAVSLNSVTCLLNGDMLFTNDLSAPHDFHVLPNLTDQLTNGYVSQALLATTSKRDVNVLEDFIRSVNPLCSVQYHVDDAVEGVLNPKNLFTEEMEVARIMSVPYVLHQSNPARKLQMATIEFAKLITSRYRVQEYVQKVSDPHSTSKMVRLKGIVHCGGEELEVCAVRGRPFGGRTKLTKNEQVMSHRQVFHVIGYDLDVAVIRNELEYHLMCKDSIVLSDEGVVLAKKKVLPTITVESLQEQDVKDVNSSMHHKDLPPGWYYDGALYVNIVEDKYQQLRPDIEALKQEYVDTYNKKIAAHNSEVDRDG